jgi:acyl-CoA hydrolase
VLLRADSFSFADHLKPGDVVLVGQGTAEPLTLTRKLLREQPSVGPLTCFLGVLSSRTFGPDAPPGMSFRAYGAMGRGVALSRAGRLEILPLAYSRLNAAFASGALRADVVLMQLAPGPDGYSLSLANDYVALAARYARLVIAEVNPEAPWTHGARLPEGRLPDLLVEAETPPLEIEERPDSAAEAAVAARVAEAIPDGACLSFGVGGVPGAVLSCLGGHRDLGIHSGVLADPCIELIARGAVTNARKAVHPGKTITNTVLGTRRLFEHVHANPAVEVRPAAVTHGLATIARLDRFHAVNSAIEVDLTGQANAERAGGFDVGGVGGQPDFVRGALASPGGRSIIALPATTTRGDSRIVARTSVGTTPRSDADLVITEHGVADLRNASLEERARRMIAIAAPEHREALARAWRDRGGVP